ncbi:sorting nexin-17 [Strongylocentrotus purpuratus]|uniref:PX domain-containing protein n=1 Tax=Strongylocentrotus purpuratus TaxID=7668 RepID=A0A7M7N2A3_STRPU|nr:sorting nexin-17 [Strongylocentrotus purpuratus]
MHFSIPDTQECKDEQGSSYRVYNVHVNGVFHCSVRYSQLHDFNEQVKKEFSNSFTGYQKFPPKKFLSLTPSQREERREKLEKYIQIVSQDPRIANSDIFNGFLLTSQKETRQEEPVDVQLEVYMMNGSRVKVDIKSTDQTDDVLERVTSEIGLHEQFTYYFALFLVIKDKDEEAGTIIRRIQDFESPYISLKAATGTCKIVLRKNYWDPSFDSDLLEDRVALQLLYVQTLSDVSRGWVVASEDQMARLQSLKAKNSKKEYIKFAQTLKYYGTLQFKQCTVNYPEPETKTVINTGNKELYFRVELPDKSTKEGVFRITRMRCWRITNSADKEARRLSGAEPIVVDNSPKKKDSQLELSFEYLVAKNKLQWVTIRSQQAILISLCLQSMVDELLLQKKGGHIKRPHDRVKGPTRQFKGRDGQVITSISTSSPVVRPELPNGAPSPTEENKTASKAIDSVKKISDKIHSASAKAQGPSAVVENEIFEGIGEEDL